MSDESSARALPPEMHAPVSVRALREFHLGDQPVAVGDTLTMPRHRAEYARFLGLVEMGMTQDT